MANPSHESILDRGVQEWNRWRSQNPFVEPDLEGLDYESGELDGVVFARTNLIGADLAQGSLASSDFCEARLRGAILAVANFTSADFRKADLTGAELNDSDLNNADLRSARLVDAQLNGTRLRGARLAGADLTAANLTSADLSGADLRGATLCGANLVEANLRNASIEGCRIHGVSAWDVILEGTNQSDLIITTIDQPTVTLDGLELAQFVYLLMNSHHLRDLLDAIRSKVVLILGRFTRERKEVLDALRVQLRNRDYVPVMFDFAKPTSRDYVETVSLLAHLSRFVIADFTDARIVLEEVPHIVRNVLVPVLPLLRREHNREPTTLGNLRRNHPSILGTLFYSDANELLGPVYGAMIESAERAVASLRAVPHASARIASSEGIE